MIVPLVKNKKEIQQTDTFPAARSVQLALNFMLPPSEIIDTQKDKLNTWLSQVGLDLNPFSYIDAGEDPLIPFYLVEHNQFDNVQGDYPSLVFAPAGGGKTAFRVRLARECRAGRNGRKIFPIVFKPSGPNNPNESLDESVHRQRTDLLRCAAQELFLYLSYYPYRLDEMDQTLESTVIQTIAWELDLPIYYYLDQMKTAGSLEPLFTAFDPTACSLPNPPSKDDVLYLHKRLRNYSFTSDKPGDEKRVELLFDLILNQLKFEAIYILIDGVDAFPETVNYPEEMLASFSWLLGNTLNWSQKNIYAKYFLPEEAQQIILETPAFLPLTLASKIIMIKWNADALHEVIRQRLQEASGGKFDSLTAISDRALRSSGRSVEETLIMDLRELKKLKPRSLIRAVDRLFNYHVQEEQVHEKLTPDDLRAVREWIRSEYSAKK